MTREGQPTFWDSASHIKNLVGQSSQEPSQPEPPNQTEPKAPDILADYTPHTHTLTPPSLNPFAFQPAPKAQPLQKLALSPLRAYVSQLQKERMQLKNQNERKSEEIMRVLCKSRRAMEQGEQVAREKEAVQRLVCKERDRARYAEQRAALLAQKVRKLQQQTLANTPTPIPTTAPAHLQKQLQKTAKQLLTTKSALQETLSKLAQLQSQLHQKQEQIEQLQYKINSLREQRRVDLKQKEEADYQSERVRKELWSCGMALEGERRKNEQLNSRMQQQTQGFQRTVKRHEDKLATLTQKYASTQQQLQSTQEQLQTLAQHLEQMSRQQPQQPLQTPPTESPFLLELLELRIRVLRDSEDQLFREKQFYRQQLQYYWECDQHLYQRLMLRQESNQVHGLTVVGRQLKAAVQLLWEQNRALGTSLQQVSLQRSNLLLSHQLLQQQQIALKQGISQCSNQPQIQQHILFLQQRHQLMERELQLVKERQRIGRQRIESVEEENGRLKRQLDRERGRSSFGERRRGVIGVREMLGLGDQADLSDSSIDLQQQQEDQQPPCNLNSQSVAQRQPQHKQQSPHPSIEIIERLQNEIHNLELANFSLCQQLKRLKQANEDSQELIEHMRIRITLQDQKNSKLYELLAENVSAQLGKEIQMAEELLEV